MRVIVCGGRYYSDVAAIWRALDQIDDVRGIRAVIEGASDDVTGPYVGADYWAHQWAKARDKETTRCHADWKKQGKAAGPIRNRRMLQAEADLLIAFPGNRGTADMVRAARAAGLEVREIA